MGQQNQELLRQEAAALGSWQWLYGTRLRTSFSCEGRYLWGGILLEMQVEAGIIQAAKVYSDAMDWQLPAAIEGILTGCRFATCDMCDALKQGLTNKDICRDICRLLEEQEL